MRRSAKVIALALAAAMALSLVACGDKDVAAKVNGEVVKKSEIDKQMEQIKQQYGDMFKNADGEARMLDFRQRLLDNAINNVLIRQAAEDEGVSVTDADIEKKITELKGNFANQEAFEAALEKAGVDIETLRTQLRDQLVTNKLVEKLTNDIKVSDAEIKDYYDKNEKQFVEKAAVHARHILFAEDDKATAEKVLKEIRGGGDFAALAKEYSKDTVSAQNGGDLGWPTTPFVTEFQSAADKLKPGKVSGLVKSPFGWHIIKVEEKREDRQKKLAEVSADVKQILVQQQQAEAYQQYIEKLKKKADIVILDPELKDKMNTKAPASGSAGDSSGGGGDSSSEKTSNDK